MKMSDLERRLSHGDGLDMEIRLLRACTPEERLHMAFRLRRVTLELCRAGIRFQHPDLNEEQVELELQRRILPPEAFQAMFGKLEWCRKSGSERQFQHALGVYKVQRDRIDADYLNKWARKLSIKDLLARLEQERPTF